MDVKYEPFVGRAGLLRTLQELLDWDRPGQESVLVLRGPRGVGKTALLGRLRERLVGSELVYLPFQVRQSTPGQLTTALFRLVLEQVTGVRVDPNAPVAAWLEDLPPAVRALVGEHSGELRVGAHPARALKCLIKSIEGLARGLGRRLVIALDEPDSLRDMQGFAGLPRRGFPLQKFFLRSPWVRWILSPRYCASVDGLGDHPDVRVLDVDRLRRADSYHLAALFLETEFRPVPRSLLWPLHGLSDGRPAYLKALVLRLLQDRRLAPGAPGAEAVRRAFLRECLEPMGRIGLACEAEISAAARGGVARAVVDVLARKGRLGLESIAQILGVGRTRIHENLDELTSRGVLIEGDGRFQVEDRVLAFRLRLLAHALGGDPAEDPHLLELVRTFEVGELVDSHGAGQWERRVRSFLRSANGLVLPGAPFGLEGRVVLPSGGVEEAAVGFDRSGDVDGFPGILAMDMLVNGRDRRWLVELPHQGRPVDGSEMDRSVRLRRFFEGSFRRRIDHLWVANSEGFTDEARDTARREGVLVSDASGLGELEKRLLLRAA